MKFAAYPNLRLRRFMHWPLALLFLYSGGIKIFRLKQFAQSVGEFGIVWDGLVKPTALLICGIELVLAWALWQQRSWSLLGTIALLVGFVGVLAYGIVIGLDIECGCFGSATKLKLWQQLIIDLLLLLWCVVGHLLIHPKGKEE